MTPPVPITPALAQREIDRFAHLLIGGQTMPLLLVALDLSTESIKMIAGPILLARLREDEHLQETIITRLRTTLGRLIAGPEGRDSAEVEGL